MKSRQLLGVVIAALAAGAVFFFWPREKVSPEGEVRALIARAVSAAEKRDASGFGDLLDDQFRGASGATRAEVKQLLLSQFFRAQQILVVNPSLDVKMESATRGHFSGTFLFARDTGLESASKYVIEGDVQKQGSDWRFVSATWQR